MNKIFKALTSIMCSRILYIAVSNSILLTLQMIPSKNLALKQTTDSSEEKKYWANLSKIYLSWY